MDGSRAEKQNPFATCLFGKARKSLILCLVFASTQAMVLSTQETFIIVLSSIRVLALEYRYL